MAAPALQDWLRQLETAAENGTLVRVVLNKPEAAAGDVKSIDVRPILVKRALKLSFTYHHTTKDIVKNHSVAESLPMLERGLRQHFRAALLCATTGDVRLVKTMQGHTLTHHPASQTAAPTLGHDRAKQRLIAPAGKPYLHALGLTNAEGQVRKEAQDKYKQLNKYVEILDGLVKQLPLRETLRVVDMGAGKGYLTFALYDHLTTTMQLNVRMVGVEQRPELVRLCNQVARDAGMAGLSFVQGSIGDYDCAGTDVVIALHACDTATDYALAKALQAQATLVVVAPCCHRQVRRTMGPVAADNPLAAMLQHGTYAERLAEMVTDTLRAQVLELHGYQTKVFEFIDGEHTPKNVMIVGVRGAETTPEKRAVVAQQMANLKALFGVGVQVLEERIR